MAEADDSVVALPIHDFTCDQDIPDPDPPSACPSFVDWSGNGNNLYYHIRYWVGFKVDAAYTQGGDNECQATPGEPILVVPGTPGQGRLSEGLVRGLLRGRPGDHRHDHTGRAQTARLAVTLIN